jgi:hypothetical protein
MMKGRHLKLAVLGVACTAAVAVGGLYSWMGQGGDDHWDTCDNWVLSGIGDECYPSASSDDARVPYAAGGWEIALIDLDRIDDFVIESDVDFTSADPNDPNGAVLVTDSLTIQGPDPERSPGIEVTITDAEIRVEAP